MTAAAEQQQHHKTSMEILTSLTASGSSLKSRVTCLESLCEDQIVQVLSRVELMLDALSIAVGLQELWLHQRTNNQLVQILTKAVYMDFRQRLPLLLADTVRVKFSAIQLATAMLNAISAHNGDAMDRLWPYCDVTFKVAHEGKLGHAQALPQLLWCKVKVHGTKKQLRLMTRMSIAEGRVTFNEIPLDLRCDNKGITVVLDTPEGEKRATAKVSISIIGTSVRKLQCTGFTTANV